MTTLKSITCPRCKKPGGELLIEGELRIQGVCDSCEKGVQADKLEAEAKEREQRRAAWWRKICPHTYSDTDLTHESLEPAFVEAAQAWLPSSNKGLGLVGKTGKGKTRLLYYCLRKAFDAGRTVFAINHVYFAKYSAMAAQFSARDADDDRKNAEARYYMQQAKNAGVLLLDDLGKAKITESANEALESLVEYRTGKGKPILWSSNAGGAWLLKRLGQDRGKAIARRLAEFGEVVKA